MPLSTLILTLLPVVLTAVALIPHPPAPASSDADPTIQPRPDDEVGRVHREDAGTWTGMTDGISADEETVEDTLAEVEQEVDPGWQLASEVFGWDFEQAPPKHSRRG